MVCLWCKFCPDIIYGLFIKGILGIALLLIRFINFGSLISNLCRWYPFCFALLASLSVVSQSFVPLSIFSSREYLLYFWFLRAWFSLFKRDSFFSFLFSRIMRPSGTRRLAGIWKKKNEMDWRLMRLIPFGFIGVYFWNDLSENYNGESNPPMVEQNNLRFPCSIRTPSPPPPTPHPHPPPATSPDFGQEAERHSWESTGQEFVLNAVPALRFLPGDLLFLLESFAFVF